MFRFSRNHHQAVSKKHKDPLHKTIKTRFGIPNVHSKHLVMIYMYHNHVYCELLGSQNVF